MMINKRKSESYLHAAARSVFKNWLDETNKESGTVRFGPFEWRGFVLEEFPFIKEISEPIQNRLGYDYVPSYEELTSKGIKPVAIADLAIEHKGMIIYAIEIVHKHDLEQNKISRLLGMKSCLELEIWRVEARWILSQIDKPTEFPPACIRRIQFR